MVRLSLFFGRRARHVEKIGYGMPQAHVLVMHGLMAVGRWLGAWYGLSGEQPARDRNYRFRFSLFYKKWRLNFAYRSKCSNFAAVF